MRAIDHILQMLPDGDDKGVRGYLYVVRAELVRNSKQCAAVSALLAQIQRQIHADASKASPLSADAAAAAAAAASPKTVRTAATGVSYAWDNEDADKCQALLRLLEARRTKMMEHVGKHVDLLYRVDAMVQIQRERSSALAALETDEAGRVLTQFPDFTQYFTGKAKASNSLIERTRAAAAAAFTNMRSELEASGK